MNRIMPLLAVAAVVLVGCAKPEETASEPTTPPATSKPDTTASTNETKSDATPVAYRNANGDLLCPVMNTTVKSEADAVGFEDFEGTRYYFCCGACPDKFKADPAKYAKK